MTASARHAMLPRYCRLPAILQPQVMCQVIESMQASFTDRTGATFFRALDAAITSAEDAARRLYPRVEK